MKRIALCLDGTWNDNKAGFVQTNVAKLQPLIAKVDADGIRQISHYIPGIANTPGETAQFLKGAVGVRHRRSHPPRLREARRRLSAGRRDLPLRLLARRLRGAELGHPHHPLRRRQVDRELPLRGGLVALSHARQEAQRGRLGRGAGGSALSGPHQVHRRVGHRRQHRQSVQSRADRSGGCSSSTTRACPISIDVGLHALSIDEIRGPFRPALWALRKGQTLPETSTHRAGLVRRHPLQRRRRLPRDRAFRHRSQMDGRANGSHYRPRLRHAGIDPLHQARSAGPSACVGHGLDLPLEPFRSFRATGEAGHRRHIAAQARAARHLAHEQAARRPRVRQRKHPPKRRRAVRPEGHRAARRPLAHDRLPAAQSRRRRVRAADAGRASGAGQAAPDQGLHRARHLRPRRRLGQLGPGRQRLQEDRELAVHQPFGPSLTRARYRTRVRRPHPIRLVRRQQPS